MKYHIVTIETAAEMKISSMVTNPKVEQSHPLPENVHIGFFVCIIRVQMLVRDLVHGE